MPCSLREPDVLVVDQRRVFDRVGAGKDRVLDRLRAMRMRRDLQAVGMGHVDHGLDLLGHHFALARHAAEREHRAGRDDLEQVGAAGGGQLGLLPELLGPARDTHAHLRRDLRFGMTRDDQVATAGRDRQVEARNLHARTHRVALVDRIAQVAIDPGDVGADVTRAGEPGQQRGARAFPRDGALLLLRAPVVDAEVGRFVPAVRQVRVHVDQAGQAGVLPEVDDGQSRGRHRTRLHRFDTAVANDDGRGALRLRSHAVDQRAALDRDGSGIGLVGHR